MARTALPLALPSPAVQARRVLTLTAQAWGVAPGSPAALARRAPHGYVRMRVARREQAQAVPAAGASLAAVPRPLLLAYSW